ncbi:hypothetical protein [Tessaracoccus coleopterorum]|nr:hypothetical protein [Tessaracoccus coleopterorum]
MNTRLAIALAVTIITLVGCTPAPGPPRAPPNPSARHPQLSLPRP